MIPYIAIVKQYERMAVFTLGKYSGMRQPGLNLLVWPFQNTEKIDLRENVIDIPRQTNITLDNAPIDIDFLVYMRVQETDAERAVLEVVDFPLRRRWHRNYQPQGSHRRDEPGRCPLTA